MKKPLLILLNAGLCLALAACTRTAPTSNLNTPSTPDPIKDVSEGSSKPGTDDGDNTDPSATEPEVDNTDYTVEFDKKELSKLIPSLIWYVDPTNTYQYEIADFFSIYNSQHYDEYEMEERPYDNSYDDVEDYVGNYAYKISKEKFDKWLYTYYGEKVDNFKLHSDYYLIESDDDSYYFYSAAGDGSLYEARSCIYDTQFAKDQAILKIDMYYDYMWNFDELINKSREEVLLDEYTDYLGSYELTFDTSDGKFEITSSKALTDENPIRLLGIATDQLYDDINYLNKTFKQGSEVPGYTYMENSYSCYWQKEGWEMTFEYFGTDIKPTDKSEDPNTREPIYVSYYYYDLTDSNYDLSTVTVGNVYFSDGSEVLYYADGHSEVHSRLKELTY